MTHENGNGEFKGSTVARLTRIESDIQELKTDVKSLRETQARFLGIIGAGAFIVPILVRVFFP